jgi:hypothetical protein
VNMNWKLVSAFATGAVLASGIVYFAVRPVEVGSVEPPKPIVASVKAPATVPPPPAPVAPSPTPVPRVAAAPVQVPVREKPSPMPPPVRRQKEVAIAKYVPPPVPPLPAPQTVEITPPPPPPAAPPPAPVAPPIPVQNVSLPAPSVDGRVPHTVTLAAGTLLPVRIGETLSSARNQAGDKFLATLTQPLVIDGFIIADRGARVEGRVIEASQAGKVKGASHLEISIVRLATDDGQNIRIRTEPYVKDGSSSTGTDAAKIGGGAAIGAIIGAIAGGGKGAAIGAGAGGAIGAGDVLLTRGQTAEIKVETRVNFKVQDPVTITERLD